MMRAVAAFVLAAGVALPAWSLPEPVREAARPWADREWTRAGEGELRWFGLKVYRAALWVSGERWSMDRPFALALRYEREISADQLVSTTLDELRRLGWRDANRLARWESALRRIFPDITPGEELVGLSVPGRGAWFFHDGRPAGAIEDAEFARAFFSIWLDARTREPSLRARLLGQS